MEDLTFIKLEGFVDEERLEQIQELVGKVGTESLMFETHELRFEDHYCTLLEELPEVGRVTTEETLRDFSLRAPGTTNKYHAQNRAKALFSSLKGHIAYSHNEADNCQCELRGGRVGSTYPGELGRYYLEPASLITAFKAGDLDTLPLDPKPSLIESKNRKTLRESVCYPILPAYISALTRKA